MKTSPVHVTVIGLLLCLLVSCSTHYGSASVSAAIEKWRANRDDEARMIIEQAIRQAREAKDDEFLRHQAHVWAQELTIYRGHEHYDEVRFLWLIGPVAIPEIVPLLEHPTAAGSAVSALGSIGGEESLRIFSKWLKDTDWHRRYRAVHGLRLMRDEKSLDLLIGLLQCDLHPMVRQSAGMALVDRQDRQALGPLIQHMDAWVGGPGSPYKVHPLEAWAGQKFGWDTPAWQEWWKRQGQRDNAGAK